MKKLDNSKDNKLEIDVIENCVRENTSFKKNFMRQLSLKTSSRDEINSSVETIFLNSPERENLKKVKSLSNNIKEIETSPNLNTASNLANNLFRNLNNWIQKIDKLTNTSFDEGKSNTLYNLTDLNKDLNNIE